MNEKKCEYCGKVITSKTAKKFCNSSCAASYTGRKYPKRKRKKIYCKRCNKEIDRKSWKDRRTVCDECNPNNVDWSKILYGDTKYKRKYQINSQIRGLARTFYRKSNKPKKCMICGYDKHYDVCHIRNISSFSDETPISVINSLENLVALCKNCHWEFDHGLLNADVAGEVF